MGFVPAQEARKSGGIGQAQVDQGQIDSLLGGKNAKRALDRHRLENPRIRMGQAPRMAQGFAKQRVLSMIRKLVNSLRLWHRKKRLDVPDRDPWASE